MSKFYSYEQAREAAQKLKTKSAEEYKNFPRKQSKSDRTPSSNTPKDSDTDR